MSRLATEKRIGGIPLRDLTVSNPADATLRYPHAALRNAFAAAPDFSYYPDPFGLEPAREAVAQFYAAQGVPVAPSRLALTASTSEAYGLLFKLLCDSGDEVLVPTPSYPLFEYLAALETVRAVPYRLAYDGSWSIDFAHLEQQLSPRSRAIVLVNPNNPTGSFLKIHEYETLLELSRKHHIPLLADEVFMCFGFGEQGGRVQTLIEDSSTLSFSLNGLSKTAGMPQMKVAWIVINGPESEQSRARERLELILDTYLSVNTPVQLALPELFSIGAGIRADIRARTSTNLQQAARLLYNSPVHALHTEGGWSLVLQLPSTRSEEAWITGLLAEENVLLQPGFFFDMPAKPYAVASLITEPAIFAEGLQRLRHYVLMNC